ncbi:MAG: class I SAM-dependent methyltransferase [Oscillospiraceae bacterium]|nr:class I SAM-dependent methyltransferase [Oscillospiraceae bacterium]
MACYNEFARFYDRFITPVDYRARAKYFDMLIKRYIGEQQNLLLDLACGTASLSIELSKLGYEVIAVDGSEQMLMEAQQKCFESGERILLLNQQMEDLDLYGTINACVCALDSLNHITDEKLLKRAISRVSLFLEPGGVFVFDMNTPYKHRELLGDNCYVYEDDDAMCVWRNRTDENLVTEIDLDFFTHRKDGKYDRSSESFCERGYDAQKVETLLAECGLKLDALYAADTLEPVDDRTERYIFVAVKE